MRTGLFALAIFLAGTPGIGLADDAWQLTTDAGYHPTWSPDGSMIAFDADPEGVIFLTPATGGTATRLFVDLNCDPMGRPMVLGQPDWSPDGSQIAGARSHALDSCTGGVWKVPSSGGIPIPYVTGQQYYVSPDWSPDGSSIAFCLGYWTRDIWAGSTQVTTHPAIDDGPTWSPDGTEIAFASERSGNWDIWAVPATGGPPFAQLTDHAGVDVDPDWHGNWIAFASDRNGNSDIWIMRSTGGTATQVTDDPAEDRTPAWSPDGTQIAFESDRTGNDFNIWIIDVSAVAVESTTWGRAKAAFR